MNITELLTPVVESGRFTIDLAKKVVEVDWRVLVKILDREKRHEAESLFYFIEGYVEEFNEGFVNETHDPELYERTRKLLDTLNRQK